MFTITDSDQVVVWMVQTFGGEVLNDVFDFLKSQKKKGSASIQVLDATVKALGAGALPLTLIELRDESFYVKKHAASHLINLDDGTHSELIRSTLENGIDEARTPTRANQPWEPLIDWVKLAAKWQPGRLTEKLWAPLRPQVEARARMPPPGPSAGSVRTSYPARSPSSRTRKPTAAPGA